ncbi:hypothetical protein [Tenacibaculum sp. M341]|nr:hypothetical protein [Tenacibaculum sp. M341]
MEISLKHTSKKQSLVAAFYIPSVNPEKWLTILHQNKIGIHDITCFLVPESLANINASGIFIVLKQPIKIENTTIQYPYYKVAENLFIPFATSLFPPLTNEELNSSFKYYMQCFHSTIGMIGWEKEDIFNWNSIEVDFKKDTIDWSLATFNPFTVPKIVSVSLIAPENEEELINELENEIDKKDLSDIPLNEDEKKTLTGQIKDKIKKTFLKAGLGVIKSLMDGGIIPSGSFSSGSGSSVSGSIGNNSKFSGKSSGITPLQKLHNWFKNNLEELEKQQQKELNKLLKMFDDNISEALKYAVPLGGDELGRNNNEPPSYKLSKQTPSFSLGNMRTGVSTYGWNVDNHYYELRQKYLKAAEIEVENKNFRKAAYIYAHLLKDYHKAANVLEQGGYYKEAAVLYLDRMHNKQSAATCYEKGMLYEEAIDIYKELDRNEKIGDLYQLLNKEDLSKKYFKITSEDYLLKEDYINAARIEKEKLKSTENSKAILLKGWTDYKKSEICLSKYFEESFEDESENMKLIIDKVYKKHTNEQSESKLLNVLTNIPLNKYKAKDLGANIAYKIISKKIRKGNTTDIYKLKSFVDDRFLGTDITRFVSNKARKKKNTNPLTIELDKNLNWVKCIKHKGIMLFVGHDTNKWWYIARVNKYGNIEYHTLKNQYIQNTYIELINNDSYSDEVLIVFTGNGKGISEKTTLHKNKYFDTTIKLAHHYEFSESYSYYSMSSNAYYAIEKDEKTYDISIYSSDKKFRKVITLKNNKSLDLQSIKKLQYFDEYLFSYTSNSLFAVDEKTGNVISLNLDTGIKNFKLLHFNNILIKTYSGLLVYSFNQKEFIIKTSLFSSDFFGKDAFFIGSDIVAVYSDIIIKLFSIKNIEAELIDTVRINGIISCLPVNRDQYAVFTKNKKIQILSV